MTIEDHIEMAKRYPDLQAWTAEIQEQIGDLQQGIEPLNRELLRSKPTPEINAELRQELKHRAGTVMLAQEDLMDLMTELTPTEVKESLDAWGEHTQEDFKLRTSFLYNRLQGNLKGRPRVVHMESYCATDDIYWFTPKDGEIITPSMQGMHPLDPVPILTAITAHLERLDARGQGKPTDPVMVAINPTERIWQNHGSYEAFSTEDPGPCITFAEANIKLKIVRRYMALKYFEDMEDDNAVPRTFIYTNVRCYFSRLDAGRPMRVMSRDEWLVGLNLYYLPALKGEIQDQIYKLCLGEKGQGRVAEYIKGLHSGEMGRKLSRFPDLHFFIIRTYADAMQLLFNDRETNRIKVNYPSSQMSACIDCVPDFSMVKWPSTNDKSIGLHHPVDFTIWGHNPDGLMLEWSDYDPDDTALVFSWEYLLEPGMDIHSAGDLLAPGIRHRTDALVLQTEHPLILLDKPLMGSFTEDSDSDSDSDPWRPMDPMDLD